MVNTY